MTDINNLRNAIRDAVADGYVADYEARNIERLALSDDNTVNNNEKAFLKDVFNPNTPDQQSAFFTPNSRRIFQRLTTYGENSISDEMNSLRRQKNENHWFNEEYVNNAVPVLVNSTDNLNQRMYQLDRLKSETNLFNNDYQQYAKDILLNSNDPIADRMDSLRNLKNKVLMYNSDYKELGTQMLLNSYDSKSARIAALKDFSNSAGLYSSEYQEILNAGRFKSNISLQIG